MEVFKIIITNEKDEIIHEKIGEFARYRDAERAAITARKEFNGKQRHIKNVK